jgi:hypothetical protein
MRSLILFGMLLSNVSYAQNGRRIGDVKYHHATAAAAAQDAISSASVLVDLRGWRICHDGGSANAYLAVSDGADPATDGVRLAAGQCYECDDCGSAALIEANVKGSAAATGYSVLQLK